jgi:hypothetical protein
MEPHMTSKDKNPKGGLSAAGRKKLRAAGQNIKPGVKGEADTPEKMRRKGSFLTRHYGRNDPHPLKKPNGEPTRYALQANAWGETPPSTNQDVLRLAAKGRSLLSKYDNKKESSVTIKAFVDEVQKISSDLTTKEKLIAIAPTVAGLSTIAAPAALLRHIHNQRGVPNSWVLPAAGAGVIGATALGSLGTHALVNHFKNKRKKEREKEAMFSEDQYGIQPIVRYAPGLGYLAGGLAGGVGAQKLLKPKTFAGSLGASLIGSMTGGIGGAVLATKARKALAPAQHKVMTTSTGFLPRYAREHGHGIPMNMSPNDVKKAVQFARDNPDYKGNVVEELRRRYGTEHLTLEQAGKAVDEGLI